MDFLLQAQDIKQEEPEQEMQVADEYVEAIPEKAFAVVRFDGGNSLEVVPCKWIISNDTTKWPPQYSQSIMEKLIRTCVDADEGWKSYKIKIYFKTNSFSKATAKLHIAKNTSNIDSNSSESEGGFIDTGSQKRKVAARYSTGVPAKIKKYQITTMPHTEVQQSHGHLAESNLLQPSIAEPCQFSSSDDEASQINLTKRHKIPRLPSNLASPKVSGNSDEKSDIKQLLIQILKLQEKNYLKLKELDRKYDQMKVEIGVVQDLLGKKSKVDVAVGTFSPDDIHLPLTDDDQLICFNRRLTEDKDLQSKFVHFLYRTTMGRNVSSFMTAVLKKLVTRSVAISYSRLGKKGKKSFMVFAAVFDTILSAAALKFQDLSPEDMAVKLGRALALASDWKEIKK